ncbi:MAG TPA: peptidase T [Thermoleophilaceae bacterium]
MTAAYTSSLSQELAPALLERFLRYVRVDTQSARERERSPSTPGQLELARMLVGELTALGLGDAAVDENGYVTATLPATVAGEQPVIGLFAHLDTSPDAPGVGVEPLVHRDYDGSAIELPRAGTVLDPERMPVLAGKLGHDIVSSSGDTLLGADDKAGVAEVMTAIAYLQAHPELPRPTLRIGFTPDEEIGEGPTLLDLDAFGASCAYTIDGSQPGELQDETFSGVAITLTIEGVEVHPGFAYGKLVNAATVAGRVLAALPADTLTPETTRGREGFIHVYEVEAHAGRAVVRLIARDFDDELLAAHVELVRRTAEREVQEAPGARLSFESRAQYPNMRRFIDAMPEVTAAAERALRAEGLEPVREPIRGGTDGSILSARGLPTPNLFTGGHEYHSVREWASLQDMAAAAAVIVRLAAEWARATA